MEFYYALINSLALAFAFANIVWGLRIFKIFLIVLGFCAGFGLGLLVGDLFGVESRSLFIWAFSGAFLVALVAWPLQRFFVFLGVGILLGFLVFAVIMSQGGEPMTGLLAGGLTLIVSGFIAVLIYDYFAIILMAMVSALIIITISFVPSEVKALVTFLVKREGNMLDAAARFAGYFSQLIWPILVVLILVVIFSIYMQKIVRAGKCLNGLDDLKRTVARRLTLSMAAIVVGFSFVDWLLGLGSKLFSGEPWSVWHTHLNALSPVDLMAGFSFTPILNIGAVSLPLSCMVGIALIRFYLAKSQNPILGHRRWLSGWILGLVLGLIILPIAEVFILLAISGFDDFNLAGNLWLGYLGLFISGPWQIILAKWFYSLIVFPILIVATIPQTLQKSEYSIKELPSDYRI